MAGAAPGIAPLRLLLVGDVTGLAAPARATADGFAAGVETELVEVWEAGVERAAGEGVDVALLAPGPLGPGILEEAVRGAARGGDGATVVVLDRGWGDREALAAAGAWECCGPGGAATALRRALAHRLFHRALQEMERQALRAERLETFGILAAGVIHGFNNLLQPVITHAELTLNRSASDRENERNLERVVRAAKRAKNLVDQMLAPADAEPRNECLEVQSIALEVVELLRLFLPGSIRVRFVTESDRCSVWADSTQLHQVLLNLCINAFHAMSPDGGLLEIGLGRVEVAAGQAGSCPPGEYVRLSVRDTGHGMDAETARRVFEPLFTTKGRGAGTGLGLALTREYLTRCGGDIAVESEPGRGTTFNVYLPPAPLANTAGQPVGGPGRGRILFVDDEEHVTLAARRILDMLGYEVVLRTSSVGALEEFKSAPGAFDLVITDQSMPHMTGAQFAAEIRTIDPEMPIIFVTGLRETVIAEESRRLLHSDYVLKPFSAREFSGAISRLLAGRRGR